MEIESAEDRPFAVATTYDRVIHPARGAAGGAAGMTGRVRLASGPGFGGTGHRSIMRGDRIIIEMPGGGFGDPMARAPSRVADDVARAA